MWYNNNYADAYDIQVQRIIRVAEVDRKWCLAIFSIIVNAPCKNVQIIFLVGTACIDIISIT